MRLLELQHLTSHSKKGKISSDPASYRPISLSGCASKILERMVTVRIRTYLENNDLLNTHQNGFRPGRSTTDSLIYLLDSVQRGFHQKNITVALFLDLKSAFDKVHHKALLIKLHNIGFRGRLTTYVKNFISNRHFFVRCGNICSAETPQQHGIPQGSPLSPILFLIFINEVFSNIHEVSPEFKYSLYADDLAIWFTFPCVDRAYKYMQLAQDHIHQWCRRWGVQISTKNQHQ